MGQLEASSSSRQRELRNRRQAADGRKAAKRKRRAPAGDRRQARGDYPRYVNNFLF
jgi:hypothetical protein